MWLKMLEEKQINNVSFCMGMLQVEVNIITEGCSKLKGPGIKTSSGDSDLNINTDTCPKMVCTGPKCHSKYCM